jgi:glycosyltransferase involved in cell wall biosynthesis
MVYTPLECLAVLASTKTICVSHSDAQQARQFRVAPRRKLVTICNGIEPRPFIDATRDGAGAVLRGELGIPESHLVIGNTGRLARQKDNQTLIRAMVPLNALMAGAPSVLLLAGEGPDRQKLEDLIRSLGLSEQVYLLGFRTDIPAFLAGLDVFVNPSLWEGLSISLLEAMAAARPIVTTSILPNAELIEHEITGLLVPARSPEHIAHAIARFVREPDLAQRCASAARQRVLEHYTIDRMFEETWDLYIDLLKQKGPRSMVA